MRSLKSYLQSTMSTADQKFILGNSQIKVKNSPVYLRGFWMVGLHLPQHLSHCGACICNHIDLLSPHRAMHFESFVDCGIPVPGNTSIIKTYAILSTNTFTRYSQLRQAQLNNLNLYLIPRTI